MRFRRIHVILLSCFFSLAVCLVPARVLAADAVVEFGSDSYESESGTEFPVGVYISGDSDIGYYRVEISYDPEKLEYVTGATSGGDGIIVFEGRGNSDVVSTMLRFKGLAGGETQLGVSDASVRVSGTDDETFNITETATVPVVLAGDEPVTETATETSTETSTETTETTETTTQTDPAGSETSVTTVEETSDNRGNNSNFQWLFIVIPVAAGVLAAILIAVGLSKKHKKNARKEYARARLNEKAKETESVKQTKKPEIVVNTASEKTQSNEITKIIPAKDPVIQVKNVSMTFKVSNANTSGLKDYMIQKVKGNLKSKKLVALDNISFDVFKGEVVGIIGTNGSGKSTLLKIVSGALRPSEGEVIADKSKIQLLTLGTGFDGELSAKENVYLNGAIIGYTKEFIDAHYDEIVEFAELQDFMDEKVKNFSSGMVSRLGFSIATVAGAAEILILDEVLSVGDQFFRRKSMERVKQMIHGGSTVLIVSHNMGTIREHCTKVVWIEKGKLKMVGEPAVVCDSYESHHNEFKLNEKGELCYYRDGVLQRNYSGIIRNNDGEYIIVKDGIQDLGYSKTKYVGGILKSFIKGVLIEDFTGMAATEKNNIVYFKDGVFQREFTGLLKSPDNKYMYFKNGYFVKNYKGVIDGHKIVDGVAEK